MNQIELLPEEKALYAIYCPEALTKVYSAKAKTIDHFNCYRPVFLAFNYLWKNKQRIPFGAKKIIEAANAFSETK